VEGIRCDEAVDFTLKNVTIQAKHEPIFKVTNVMGLNTADVTLIKAETEAG
jgi:hypothetical protein